MKWNLWCSLVSLLVFFPGLVFAVVPYENSQTNVLDSTDLRSNTTSNKSSISVSNPSTPYTQLFSCISPHKYICTNQGLCTDYSIFTLTQALCGA